MKKYALLIGNGQFAEDSGLAPLRYTNNDVFRLESVLRPTYDRVIPVVDKNRWKILDELQSTVDRLKPNDLLLIYYSGHGETYADSKLFLAASNTKKKQLASTGVDYDDILLILKNHYCENALIILDCCYSGMADVMSRGQEKAPPLGDVVNLSSGVCLMTASSAHEVAKERGDYQGGTFTHYLIQGLQQGIGINHPDGIIRPQDLYEYAFKAIKHKGYEQTPHIKSSMTGILPFFTQKPVTVDVLAELKDRLLFAKDQTTLKLIIEELDSYLQNHPNSDKAKQLITRAQQLWIALQPKPEPSEPSPRPVKKKASPRPETNIKVKPKDQIHRAREQGHTKSFVKPLILVLPVVLGMMIYLGTDSEKPYERKADSESSSQSTTDSTDITTPTSSSTITSSSLFPRMVNIQGGTFKMGCQPTDSSCSDNEKPLHPVTLKAFKLSATEVTFEQYDHYCEQVSACKKPDDQGWGRGTRPVINVSWEDAQAYINWLNQQPGHQGYRLPTEAEWEYAARAGTTTKYSWGDSFNADYTNNNGKNTLPVGSLLANPWGLYDMHGNVWEWCEDKRHSNYEGAPTNGTAWIAGGTDARVLRGGSWLNFSWNLRSSNRDSRRPSERLYIVGFRVAQVY